MSKIKISILAGILLLSALASVANVYGQNSQQSQMPKLNCQQCHTCDKPTPESLCLKACPTMFMAQSQKAHNLSEAPDSMLLDKLVDQYGPVHFNHKLHATMSDMGKGCPTCHHFSPTGRIPKCRECHVGEANAQNLRQPSLKGAYHRQCLSCHREWSHDTQCALCHNPLEKGKLMNSPGDKTDIMGISHPIIPVPVKQVYYTPYKSGAIVTFYHKQHIDLFGLRCVDCHLQEDCSTCHDLKKPVKIAKSQEEVHAICSNCHGSDKCNKCHDNKERLAFSHASTGWALNRFHQALDCRSCHPTGKKIAKLENQCSSCHAGWNQENFKHAITGLQLDETHAQLECSDCHAEKKYDSQVSCANCHDDGRTLKSKPPGKIIRLTKG